MRRPHLASALILAGLMVGAGVAAPAPNESNGNRLVIWEGKAANFKYSRRSAGYYTADEFSLTLDIPGQGRRLVISREPTPFEAWRMGTTFTGLAVDWSRAPLARVVGMKGIDRIPPTFPGLKLEPEQTITALILEVQVGGRFQPWYVNNWFHRWSTPEEDRRIAREYVGRDVPYDVYGFKDDLLAELTPASRQVTAAHPTWRCYHGVLVADASAAGGYALQIRHLFAKNARTGAYDCVYGDPRALVPLSRPSPVAVGTGGSSPTGAQPVTKTTQAPPTARPAPTRAVGGIPVELPTGVRITRDPPPVRGAAPAVPAPKPDAALAVAADLAGDEDWWMVGGGPEHRGQAPALAPPLRLLWEARAGKEFAGGPAAVGNRVFIGNNDGKLYCFEAASGRPLWSFATRAEIEATPTVWNGLVLVGSFDGNVYGVDAATGKERWRFATGARLAGFKGIEEVKQGVDSSIAVVSGRAYFGAWDGKAYCLDAASGKQIWAKQLGGIVHWHSPAVGAGKVLIGATDGKLYCLAADSGVELWTAKLCEPNMDHMMSGAAILGSTAFVGGGYENGVYALSLADGSRRWQFKAANLFCGMPAVDSTAVFGLADGGGQVFALDRATGKALWTRNFGKGWGACPPVLSGTVLYVTMRDGSENGKPVALVALDASNGKTLWSHPTGGAWSGPAFARGRLFYGSDDGKLRAFAR